MKCYDRFWLHKDMEDMGYMFEYCDQYSKEIYGTSNIDKVAIMKEFMASRFRKEMEQGQPKFLSQASYDSFQQWTAVDYNGDITRFCTNKKQKFKEKQMYWVGWMYAYIHYKSKKSSKHIEKAIPIEDMLEHYKLGHEINQDTFYKNIKHLL